MVRLFRKIIMSIFKKDTEPFINKKIRLDRKFIIIVLLVCSVCSLCCKQHAENDHSGWPAYAGSKEGNRYSSNTQINAENVSRLKVAWTFSTSDKDTAGRTQI